MKNCGRRFHNEVGKFRFLNELIKVVSPKVSLVAVFLITVTLCLGDRRFLKKHNALSGCLCARLLLAGFLYSD